MGWFICIIIQLFNFIGNYIPVWSMVVCGLVRMLAYDPSNLPPRTARENCFPVSQWLQLLSCLCFQLLL